MKFQHIIATLKQSSFMHVKSPLGRWKIHNHTQTALKIKYANEDNCFTSYQYNKQNNDKIQYLDKVYVYMMGFETIPDIKKPL